MILTGILAFGVMLAVGFMVGCALANSVIVHSPTVIEAEGEEHDER